MKKFMLLLIAVFSVAVLSGGCCSAEKCNASKKCAKTVKCDRPCAKSKKGCPFLGKWEFFVVKGDKLEALPVSPQPYMEFCKGGLLRFHFSKDGKAQVIEGRWKVAGDKIDEIIAEPVGGAQRNHKETILRVGDVIARHLKELSVHTGDELKKRRTDKFLKMGRHLAKPE